MKLLNLYQLLSFIFQNKEDPPFNFNFAAGVDIDASVLKILTDPSYNNLGAFTPTASVYLQTWVEIRNQCYIIFHSQTFLI